MESVAPSRAAMHDLILPPPVSFWPATPAWYLLGCTVLLLALLLVWRSWRAWCHDAYRRAALRALQTAQQPADIAAILKRTALAGWPRRQVAALSGAEWAGFLRRTAPSAQISEAVSIRMAELAYAPLSSPDVRVAAERWIRHHDVRA